MKRRIDWAVVRASLLAVFWVAALVLGLMLVGRELLTSERFAVAKVELIGVEQGSNEELRARADVPLGSNIFRVNLDAVRERVAGHPWVKAVRVSRRLPRQIEIRVQEHEPVLLVALGELYLASREGAIIKSYEPGDPWSLPVVTGLLREDVESDADALLPALRLERAWRSTEGLPEISEIRLHELLGVTVRTTDGRQLWLGRTHWAQKMERVRAILGSEATADATDIRLEGRRRMDRATVVLPPSASQGEN